jgi:hypothetical protein
MSNQGHDEASAETREIHERQYVRPGSIEVLHGLQLHARGQERAVRAGDLADKLGMPSKVVSNALNWLTVEQGKHPKVRRAQSGKGHWYRYWWEE